MRKAKAIKNIITAVISNIVVFLFGFITQKVFILSLGDEYLGLNALFSNIVSMLAIVELGIGSAICYSLYEPIAKNDTKKIVSLLSFYRKTYNIVSIIIFVLSIIMLPFLRFFVKTTLNINIYIVFMLFVIDVIFSYTLAYKRSILIADQRSDIINIVHIIYLFALNSSLIVLLLLTKNYFLYLIIKCVFRFLENFVISILVDKKYPFLKEKATDIDKKTLKSIEKKVKGLFFHKVGAFFVLGTDNIIISNYLGNVILSFYSNYYLVINAINNLLSQIFYTLTASVGNLLVEKNNDKSYEVFKNIMFFNFWIYSFSAIGIFVCMSSFVSFWVGVERVLPIMVLLILCINFYMSGMKLSLGIYKDAAGIFYEDRFIPIIESIINIIASIILVKHIGLIGVFIGTFISSLIVVFFSLPYYTYKKIFERKITEYYTLYMKYILLAIISGSLTYFIFLMITRPIINNYILKFLIGFCLSVIIPNLIYLIIFHKTTEFKYYFEIFSALLKKIKKQLIKNKNVN